MNRINQLFQDSPKNLLSIYFCAGCPTLEGTADVIRTLERNGVHSIEIGIPFSDPMADGIVIQEAATRRCVFCLSSSAISVAMSVSPSF